ncbi:MAG: Clp domain protein [Modestobacter sp.]|nr:Clp domain protein [Modestobacter sp.]
MLERFTDEARHVVVAVCRRPPGSTPTGWGPPPGGSADPLDADALAALGVDLDQVRAAAEAAFGPGALGPPPTGGHIGFAGGSKRSLEEALRSAVRRRDRRLDTGHLLAGVLAVGDPQVSRVLRELGTDPRDPHDQA